MSDKRIKVVVIGGGGLSTAMKAVIIQSMASIQVVDDVDEILEEAKVLIGKPSLLLQAPEATALREVVKNEHGKRGKKNKRKKDWMR